MSEYNTILNTQQPIMECVANFSEGKDKSIIDAIAESIRLIPNQKLLHIDTSVSANRTVMTFAGNPEAVSKAAFNAIKTAAALIDMRQQQGAHPRIGATDVCPFVPLLNMRIEDAVHWASTLASSVGKELGIPVYLYEYNATQDYRRALPNIRKGQYEDIVQKVFTEKWQPDFWDETKDLAQLTKTGATVIGARKVLVAFNISLDTKDEYIATLIAQKMRSSGYKEKLPDGTTLHHKGLLPQLRAIGWYMDDFDHAQVSMNLLDYNITSPLTVMNLCSEIAKEFSVNIIGAELIGLIPETCIIEAGQYKLSNNYATKEKVIAAGIELLQLQNIKPFSAEEHILENKLLELV